MKKWYFCLYYFFTLFQLFLFFRQTSACYSQKRKKRRMEQRERRKKAPTFTTPLLSRWWWFRRGTKNWTCYVVGQPNESPVTNRKTNPFPQRSQKWFKHELTVILGISTSFLCIILNKVGSSNSVKIYMFWGLNPTVRVKWSEIHPFQALSSLTPTVTVRRQMSLSR